ncbi:MAG: RNA 2',3'-cyclic phosphodiesterase [Actinobacteria bacterium]|uniref:Unannotated protein n=1 Tax=freshwater metagenome TaxID=449393 RepID=A0A6J6A2K9_9ZZZZ|nr:RNA 2',3'-cyclic phosphodiesterase [Actinomycetota bacterium]MSW77267.1 RNA 2',3'-cyclic phosphodiesterase [Actinomycetota bacterium]MSX56868.1 RNA 2',3'-cyclic phosphodiesterase [Actinomycetota bacterium]MSZ82802.1 RNA 2',3'-cyclic phosphodiesterase [Actinomycetota bacterium]MTB17704.1 RNA 2',3'-cyclic phosphodiesterase [Actinomycetota bacterium]
MARLFIAVWPPEEVAEQLRELHRKEQRGVRFVDPDNWHLTVRFLGEADPREVVAALDGATFPATHVSLGPAVDVHFDRALVVPASGLEDLAHVVNECTKGIGEPPRKRFVGHLTIARVQRDVPMPRVLGAYVRAEFLVREIVLVQSWLEPQGARYATLETWPVDGWQHDRGAGAAGQ